MVTKKFKLEDLSGARILITGHTGFKGTWLTKVLNKTDAEVFGLSLKPKKHSLYNKINNLRLSGSKFIDVGNQGKVRRFLKEVSPDLVIHMAAQPLVLQSYENPVETFQTNVMGTVNILQASTELNSVKGVIVVTSDKVYRNDELDKPFSEDDPLGGKDPYSASKSASEMVVNAWRSLVKEKYTKLVSARSGNVIGGGDYSDNRLLPDLIKGFKEKKVVEIRNPDSIRPWQHVLEPIYGYLNISSRILEGVVTSNCYNFGPNENSKMSVAQISDEACQLWPQAAEWKKCRETSSHAESKLLWLSSELAMKELSWVSKLSAREAVKWTVEWELNAELKNATFATDTQINSYLELVE